MSSTATATRPAVTGYDPEVRFYATRYNQGGRTVYSLDLSLSQIAGLIPAPDPATPQPGNRRVTTSHAAAFGNYVRSNEHWVVPAIVLRGVSQFDFETLESIEGTEFGIISLPFVALTEIHILDGQHRILGIHLALRGIAAELEKSRNALNRAVKRVNPDDPDTQEVVTDIQDHVAVLNKQRIRFEKERASVQIFVEDGQTEYQQMFYDIADNALGLPASVKARFDTRKAVNRVLQDVLAHPLLAGRVDLEADRLGRSNPNLLSAKHVVEIVRTIAVGIEGRIGRRVESELDERDLLARSNKFFDILSESFPLFKDMKSGEISAADLRASSMIGSPVIIRTLAGVYQELRKRGVSFVKIKKFFSDLDPFLSRPASKDWVARTGGELFFEGALSPTSRRQDLLALSQTMVQWAEDRPAWLLDK